MTDAREYSNPRKVSGTKSPRITSNYENIEDVKKKQIL